MNDVEIKLWAKARRYVRFLRWIPGLRMVAVCNSLAMGSAAPDSDIDLFIIARTGRLFTVRFLVTGVLHLLGVRRHGRRVAGRFCLSFFIDDSALDLSVIAIENDLYLKRWIDTLVPLIDDGVYEKFIEKNISPCKSDFGDLLDVSPVLYFENFLKKWQLNRARGKMKLAGPEASLVANDHMLKFHNIDRRAEYRDTHMSLTSSIKGW